MSKRVIETVLWRCDRCSVTLTIGIGENATDADRETLPSGWRLVRIESNDNIEFRFEVCADCAARTLAVLEAK